MCVCGVGEGPQRAHTLPHQEYKTVQEPSSGACGRTGKCTGEEEEEEDESTGGEGSQGEAGARRRGVFNKPFDAAALVNAGLRGDGGGVRRAGKCLL